MSDLPAEESYSVLLHRSEAHFSDVYCLLHAHAVRNDETLFRYGDLGRFNVTAWIWLVPAKKCLPLFNNVFVHFVVRAFTYIKGCWPACYKVSPNLGTGLSSSPEERHKRL